MLRAEETLWETDFRAAKAKAKAEKKLLLVDFTGSDWCRWCRELQEEVFDQEGFKAEAPKRLVLVKLDFPHAKKLPEELQKQNRELSDHYKVHFYPTVLVMDAAGEVIAKTGYCPGGLKKYLQQLAEFTEIYHRVLQMKIELERVKSLDRARLLDQLVDAYVKLNNENDETGAWSREIIALDAENKAGLKHKHEFRVLLAEAKTLLFEERNVPEGRALVAKALAMPGLAGDQIQEADFLLGVSWLFDKDWQQGIDCLKKAVDAAPKSPLVPRLRMTIRQVEQELAKQPAGKKD